MFIVQTSTRLLEDEKRDVSNDKIYRRNFITRQVRAMHMYRNGAKSKHGWEYRSSRELCTCTGMGRNLNMDGNIVPKKSVEVFVRCIILEKQKYCFFSIEKQKCIIIKIEVLD